jgi:UDP-N-acetylmuramoyl-tripeptide--D-alanyl-D-alanine ligase
MIASLQSLPPGRRVPLAAGDVVSAARGKLLAGDAGTVVDGVSIDTRTLRKGELYFALRGERFDGHDFVPAAIEAGAAGIVVVEPPRGLSPDVLAGRLLIVVADTILALQALARWVRRASAARVVAVTGSAGKTTTKEIIASFLRLRHDVMHSTGNLNNHIGLPLSLLGFRLGPQVGVVELGMNHPGEIRRLVAIAEPDVRVWTNVAEVHTEFFPSLDAIADAKAEILEGASEEGLLVANRDDERVMARVSGFAGRVRTFGLSRGADVRADGVEELGLRGTRAVVHTRAGDAHWEVPLPGTGNLLNSLAALAVGLEFGVPLEGMAASVRDLKAARHRGELLRLPSGVTLLDDSYNSNPRALEVALRALAQDPHAGRKIAVLGEMLELGEQSAEMHARCGARAARSGLALLLTVGGEPARAMGAAAVQTGMKPSAVLHAATSDEAAETVLRHVRPGDIVLVKGSRGIKTDRVVERLLAESR